MNLTPHSALLPSYTLKYIANSSGHMNGLDQKYESIITVAAAKIYLLRGETSRKNLAGLTYRNQPGGYASNNECHDR
jgi:hypothetical protein